jgi:hypothetical protein
MAVEMYSVDQQFLDPSTFAELDNKLFQQRDYYSSVLQVNWSGRKLLFISLNYFIDFHQIIECCFAR